MPEEDLRSHIAWGSTRLMAVFGLPVAGDAQVCDSGVSASVQDDIFGLDVTMNDVALV